MQPMVHFTIKRGALRRTLVATQPPFPTVGDAVKGTDGELWEVVKVSKTKGQVSADEGCVAVLGSLSRLPVGRAWCRASSPGGQQ